MPKVITARQQRFLFSNGSPLGAVKKKRLAGEIRSGIVRIIKKKPARGGRVK